MKIQVGQIAITRFKPEHTDLLFQVINNPEVRKGMQHTAPISYESHLSWVKENLIDHENVHLFLVADDKECQGVVLIKNLTNDSGELGIMMADIFYSRENMLTSKMITGILYYAFQVLKISQLSMSILPDNFNSLSLAKKIGAVYIGENQTYLFLEIDKFTYYNHPLNALLFKRYKPCLISC